MVMKMVIIVAIILIEEDRFNNEDEDLGIRMPQQYDGNGEGSDSFQDLFQLLQELFTLLCAGNSKDVPEVMYKKIKQL